MNEKRSLIGVVKGMFVGIVKPAEYIENGKKGSWGSALLLAIIFSILTPLLTFYLPVNTVIGGGRLARALDRELPDFRLSKDEFYCEDSFIWDDTENSSIYLEVDTDNTYIAEDVLEDILQKKDYQTVVIVYSKEVLLYSEGQSNVLTWSDIYDAFDESSYDMEDIIDKQVLVNFIETSLGPITRAVYFFLVVFAFIGFLLCGLLWALIGLMAASSNRTKISFGELLKASIYIRIIWVTIRKLLKVYVFGGTSMLMWTFGFIVILIYMLLAVSKYAKKQPDPLYGGGIQAIPNQNMYYSGQSMGNMAGQHYPTEMNMNAGVNQNLNPNMNQNTNWQNGAQNPYQMDHYPNGNYPGNDYSGDHYQADNSYSNDQNNNQS